MILESGPLGWGFARRSVVTVGPGFGLEPGVAKGFALSCVRTSGPGHLRWKRGAERGLRLALLASAWASRLESLSPCARIAGAIVHCWRYRGDGGGVRVVLFSGSGYVAYLVACAACL